MLEDSILKSNFIGRDGFRWWIGQVASEEAQGDQLNQIGSTLGDVESKFVSWVTILKIL